jgi:hypothetical protein
MISDCYSRDGNNIFTNYQESEEDTMNDIQWSEQPYQKDEWVKVIDHTLDGFVGYILNYDFWASKYLLYITQKPDGEATRGQLWVHKDRIMSINNERHQDDIAILIDLALDENDKELFLQLSSQLALNNY